MQVKKSAKREKKIIVALFYGNQRVSENVMIHLKN